MNWSIKGSFKNNETKFSLHLLTGSFTSSLSPAGETELHLCVCSVRTSSRAPEYIYSGYFQQKMHRVTVLQSFMHLLSQLLFSTGRTKWCTIGCTAISNCHFGPRAPVVSSSRVAKSLFTGKCEKPTNLSGEARHNVRGDLLWAAPCHQGFLCFPQVWFELKLLRWRLSLAPHYAAPPTAQTLRSLVYTVAPYPPTVMPPSFPIPTT